MDVIVFRFPVLRIVLKKDEIDFTFGHFPPPPRPYYYFYAKNNLVENIFSMLAVCGS